jgi:hypothetical protein
LQDGTSPETQTARNKYYGFPACREPIYTREGHNGESACTFRDVTFRLASGHGPIEELLRIFNENHVKYLVVGGYAVMLYTEPRYTKDLDVWVEANVENANRVFHALPAFGAPPVRVDILMAVDGLTLEEAWPNRVESTIGKQPAWFIGRADLIKNKRASGRHIDLHDAQLLE